MAAVRQANVVWQGDLLNGSGTILDVTSGVLSNLPVSWAARTEEPGGKTSPEDLLAAAHASCFAMALSGALARNGTPPEQLNVGASVTFDKADSGWRVTTSELTVRGKVPGLDANGFQQAAQAASEGCPISQALKGNVKISVQASLE